MNSRSLIYSPKQQPIQYLQVTRKQNFKRNSIHMHDHHELVLVSSRSVIELVNNGNAFSLQGPCVFINRAGSFHEVVQVSQADYESHVAFFHPHVLLGLPEDMLFHKQLFASDLTALSVTGEQMQTLRSLITLMADRPHAQQKPLLLAILAAMAELCQKGAPIHAKSGNEYIFDIIALFRTEGSFTIEQLAEQFHVCPTKLKADFKRLTGRPIMTYRNQIRLEKARLLLKSSDLRQSQIAFQCGFSDESYFIRAFHKEYGITPAVYRRQRRCR